MTNIYAPADAPEDVSAAWRRLVPTLRSYDTLRDRAKEPQAQGAAGQHPRLGLRLCRHVVAPLWREEVDAICNPAQPLPCLPGSLSSYHVDRQEMQD